MDFSAVLSWVRRDLCRGSVKVEDRQHNHQANMLWPLGQIPCRDKRGKGVSWNVIISGWRKADRKFWQMNSRKGKQAPLSQHCQSKHTSLSWMSYRMHWHKHPLPLPSGQAGWALPATLRPSVPAQKAHSLAALSRARTGHLQHTLNNSNSSEQPVLTSAQAQVRGMAPAI